MKGPTYQKHHKLMDAIIRPLAYAAACWIIIYWLMRGVSWLINFDDPNMTPIIAANTIGAIFGVTVFVVRLLWISLNKPGINPEQNIPRRKIKPFSPVDAE